MLNESKRREWHGLINDDQTGLERIKRIIFMGKSFSKFFFCFFGVGVKSDGMAQLVAAFNYKFAL